MTKSNIPGRDKLLVDLIDSTAELTKAFSRALRFGVQDFNRGVKKSPSEEIMSKLEEFAELTEQLLGQLPRPPVNYMAKTVLEWFDNSPERMQEEFVTTEFENLAVFMPSMGLSIIDHFNLGAYPWNVQPNSEGMDVSPNRPEAVALQVIETVWRMVKND